MDKLKIKLTIAAAIQALDRLEKALDEGDQRKVGAALYEIRRELHILKTETKSGKVRKAGKDD